MLEPAEGKIILTLRLLIARAAQKDSLNWWEDDSLTPTGAYLLDKLILINVDEASRKLALEAAKVRYRGAFGENNPAALHLFHLDQTGEVEYSLQDIKLTELPLPAHPIKTMDEFRQLLLEHVGAPLKYQVIGERRNNSLEINLKEASLKPDLILIAKTLAWATLASEPGKPIFPYIQPTL